MKKITCSPSRIALGLTCRFVIGLSIVACAGALTAMAAELGNISERAVTAPPPAPPPMRSERGQGAAAAHSVHLLNVPAGLTLYSIGEPSDEEQLYLEYINRARRDPAAEGRRLAGTSDASVLSAYNGFGVDLPLFVAQMDSISAAPPLSLNSNLTAAARAHSQDMLAHAFQAHDGTDGSTIGTRTTGAGYIWTTVSENIYASADSVEHGHAAFEVDWGGPASNGGMQDPPGHRTSIHSAEFAEIGIGVVRGTNGTLDLTVGPQLVTQDFGNRDGLTPFVTGVVYYDLNGNGAYDAGEGLGGAVIQAAGASFYARSAGSGGYSLPVPGNGSYAVRLSVSGSPDSEAAVAVSAQKSVKHDFRLAYSPLVISGSDKPSVNQANAYAFSAVGGATGYQWRQAALTPSTEVEGAENGLANVTAAVSSGYNVIDNFAPASGTRCFHLAHPGKTNAPPVDQFLALNRTYQAGASAQLLFASRLGWATPKQVAHAQVTLDEGQNWQDVWTQAGTGNGGDGVFSTHTISLAALAGKAFKVRFVYAVGASFFSQTDPGVGLYLDNISVIGADQLGNETIAVTPSSASFSFLPSQTGAYSLSVRATTANRAFPWGPEKVVTAQVGSSLPSNVQIGAVQRLADGRLQIAISVTNPGVGTYGIQGASTLAGPWADDPAATFAGVAGSTEFHGIITPGSSTPRFYRIVVR